MSTVMDYLRWYHESDDADGDTMDTAELAVAYAKHCLSEELREVFAIHKAEIDALKAQNADLLKALQNLTENVVFYHRNGISDLKDAKADRNNAVKIALIVIGIEADPDLEFSDWQPSPAIAKALGDL